MGVVFFVVDATETRLVLFFVVVVVVARASTERIIVVIVIIFFGSVYCVVAFGRTKSLFKDVFCAYHACEKTTINR